MDTGEGFFRLVWTEDDKITMKVLNSADVLVGRAATEDSDKAQEFVQISHNSKVSRSHLRFFWDDDATVWKLQVLGKHGIVVDEVKYAKGDVVELHDQSAIHGQGIKMFFQLPHV